MYMYVYVCIIHTYYLLTNPPKYVCGPACGQASRASEVSSWLKSTPVPSAACRLSFCVLLRLRRVSIRCLRVPRKKIKHTMLSGALDCCGHSPRCHTCVCVYMCTCMYICVICVCVCVCVCMHACMYIHKCYVLTKPPIPSWPCNDIVILRPIFF
jgi:hypothetical protein